MCVCVCVCVYVCVCMVVDQAFSLNHFNHYELLVFSHRTSVILPCISIMCTVHFIAIVILFHMDNIDLINILINAQ